MLYLVSLRFEGEGEKKGGRKGEKEGGRKGGKEGKDGSRKKRKKELERN